MVGTDIVHLPQQPCKRQLSSRAIATLPSLQGCATLAGSCMITGWGGPGDSFTARERACSAPANAYAGRRIV